MWKSLAGMLDVELTSAEPELALHAVNSSGIELVRVRQVDMLTYLFRIRRTDYKALAALCEKRGEPLKVLRRTGLYWAGKRLLRHPLLVGGLSFFLILALYLPSRVFFVRVYGNTTVPDNRILAAAEESGICFGASRRHVRSEKVKNTLLEAVPELQWAGINTAGCVATISVRERTKGEDAGQEEYPVTSIVAARDGYILSGTVIRGNPLFQTGQTVKQGQVLVSGYTDCGICIQATRAEGEILAQTNRELTVTTPSQRLIREDMTGTAKKYSLLLGKKRINLWKDSGNIPAGCDRIYMEYYVTLPGGFDLPIALCVETVSAYKVVQSETPQEEAEAALSEFAGNYLTDKMVAGKILSRSESVFLENEVYCLYGEYVCTEMIGRVRREQIGDFNGKNS